MDWTELENRCWEADKPNINGFVARYRLGGGKMYPIGTHPFDEVGTCDCSAFVCWALKIAKYQPDNEFLKKYLGMEWYNTDAIWRDIMATSIGYFGRISVPQPGCVVVYPSRRTLINRGTQPERNHPKIGHAGIVWKDNRVIHCSARNQRQFGRPIMITDQDVFSRRNDVVYGWPTTLTENHIPPEQRLEGW